jgi:hypothetical protein
MDFRRHTAELSWKRHSTRSINAKSPYPRRTVHATVAAPALTRPVMAKTEGMEIPSVQQRRRLTAARMHLSLPKNMFKNIFRLAVLIDDAAY